MAITSARETPGQKALRDWMERRDMNQREAAKVLGIHYMCLNQYLQIGERRRQPGLASALLIQDKTGIPMSIWALTKVSVTRRRKTNRPVTENKQAAYSHVD